MRKHELTHAMEILPLSIPIPEKRPQETLFLLVCEGRDVFRQPEQLMLLCSEPLEFLVARVFRQDFQPRYGPFQQEGSHNVCLFFIADAVSDRERAFGAPFTESREQIQPFPPMPLSP